MNDDNILTINEQGIAEVNPTASRDAQLAFIDTYRQTQGENNQQIADQTHALGSDLPAQLGGLHGPSEYTKSRYQVPQTESRVANLRTAAQLSALNQLLENDQARWKDKYNQAYRNYKKRQYKKANSLYNARTGGSSGNGGSGGGGNELTFNTNTGAQDTFYVNDNPNTGEGNIVQTGDGTYQNVSTGETYTNAPTSFMGLYNQGMSLGVWPDGSPFTIGSTYTQGGKTYTYNKLANMPTPSVFVVGG